MVLSGVKTSDKGNLRKEGIRCTQEQANVTQSAFQKLEGFWEDWEEGEGVGGR